MLGEKARKFTLMKMDPAELKAHERAELREAATPALIGSAASCRRPPRDRAYGARLDTVSSSL